MRRTLYVSLMMLLLWQFRSAAYAQPVIYKDRVFEGKDFEKIQLTAAHSGSRFINCTFRNIILHSGGVISVDGAQDIIFDGCTFENIAGDDYKDVHAIVCGTKGSDVIIRNCKFKNIAADGIQMGNNGEEIRNWQIIGNEFYDCRENGIDLKRVHGNILIKNNYFTETKFCKKGETIGCTGGGGAGIVIHMGSNGVTIDGNKFYKNGHGITVAEGVNPDEYGAPDNITVINNMIYKNAEHGLRIRMAKNTKIYNNTFVHNQVLNLRIELDEGQVADVKNNLFVGSDKYTQAALSKYMPGYGNLLYDDISKAGFVNPDIDDYHLKSTSPAVDAGVEVASIETDIDGDQRMIGKGYDVGADEQGTSSAPANISPTVSIVSPSTNTTVEAGKSFTISAQAKDQDGTVMAVKFYDGQKLIAEDKTSPYTHEILHTVAGECVLTAVAIDDKGATTTSSAIKVVIEDKEDDNTNPDEDNNDELTNGLQYAYYEGKWKNLPDFGNLAAKKKGIVSNFTLSPRNIEDYYAFLFYGYIKIEKSGTYTFYTSSDDGSRLYIGSKMVVNNDGRHAMQEKSGQMYLSQGVHSIKVHFFEYKGKEKLNVSYAGPGISKRTIPDYMLFTENTEKQVPPTENISPTVSIVNPSTNTTVEADNGITFTLVNAKIDQPVTGFNPIVEGAVINLAEVGTDLNIVAHVNGISNVAKVRFGYNNNGNYHTEKQPPYAIAGDNSGDFSSWTPATGDNKLIATVFSKDGTKLAEGILNFKVIDNSSARLISNIKAYPNPAVSELHVTTESSQEVTYNLIDNAGNTVKSGKVKEGSQVIKLDVQDLKTGIYYLKVITNNSYTTRKIFVDK